MARVVWHLRQLFVRELARKSTRREPRHNSNLMYEMSSFLVSPRLRVPCPTCSKAVQATISRSPSSHIYLRNSKEAKPQLAQSLSRRVDSLWSRRENFSTVSFSTVKLFMVESRTFQILAKTISATSNLPPLLPIQCFTHWLAAENEDKFPIFYDSIPHWCVGCASLQGKAQSKSEILCHSSMHFTTRKTTWKNWCS